jgi:hypothetical protein
MSQRRVSRDNEARLQHFIECVFMLEPQKWNEFIKKYTADEVIFFALFLRALLYILNFIITIYYYYDIFL